MYPKGITIMLFIRGKVPVLNRKPGPSDIEEEQKVPLTCLVISIFLLHVLHGKPFNFF
jgi:hypothetical protein